MAPVFTTTSSSFALVKLANGKWPLKRRERINTCIFYQHTEMTAVGDVADGVDGVTG